MRKIWLIFKQDLKNIFNNGAMFIIIVVVLIVPSLFAAFIIKANWTPINNSKEVRIAIVNKDRGGVIYNKVVNIGNMVAENVEKDIYLNWEILPYDQAFRGFLLGEIYGVIVIPEEFTQGIATVTTDTPILPKIAYMINEKESVFTPTVTGTSGIRLQIHVARNITYAINNAVKNALKEYNIDFTIDNTVIKETVNALLDLDTNREEYIEKLKEYRDLVGSMMVLLTNLEDELPDLSQTITRVENIINQAERFFDAVDELGEEYEAVSGGKMELQVQKIRPSFKN